MALFSKYEIIMYLSDNLAQKERIETNINRKLTIVNDLNAFVEVLEESRNKTGKVNIIVPKDMSKNIQANLNDVVAAINTITSPDSEIDAMIFSIGLGDIFDKAYAFGTITAFVDYVRKHERHQRITELENSEDEQDKHGAMLLKELMLENDAHEERQQEAIEYRKKSESIMEELQAEVDKMKLEIETVYKIQIDNNDFEMKKLEDSIEDLQRKLLIETEKMEDYQKESNHYRNLNKSLELDKKSLEEHIEDLRNDMNLLKRQIVALKKDAEKNEKLHAELYNSHVDSEKYAILKAELDATQKAKREVENELVNTQIMHKKQGYKLNEVLEENRNLRQGDVDLIASGRTVRLDTHNFKSINLFYIKVVQEFPYLNSHIKEFIRQIDNHFTGNTTTCIIDYDEGLSNELFPNIDVYSNIGSVPQNIDMFLLYPSQRMMTDADDFEEKYNNLIVIDYIKSPNYYMTTESFYRIFTAVRYSTQIKEYSLRGLPLSLDGTSVLNLQHDVRMVTATTNRVRQKMIEGKVTDWLEKSHILS